MQTLRHVISPILIVGHLELHVQQITFWIFLNIWVVCAKDYILNMCEHSEFWIVIISEHFWTFWIFQHILNYGHSEHSEHYEFMNFLDILNILNSELCSFMNISEHAEYVWPFWILGHEHFWTFLDTLNISEHPELWTFWTFWTLWTSWTSWTF